MIWPHLEVDARWVRFRIVNASNSRFSQFQLRDDNDQPIRGALVQIGTDGGLLGAPVALDQPPALTLAPAERADILVNFGAHRGQRLRLVNTLAPSPDPNFDVMQFRVRTFPVSDPFTLPNTLSPSFVRLTHDTLPVHGHRWLVLTVAASGHPEMWEMIEIEPPASLPVEGADGIVQVRLADETVTTLQRVGRTFRMPPISTSLRKAGSSGGSST